MEGNNCNSDKITIKVQLPSDDYHDISIDWSTANFRRQIFHQLATYTGIPVKYTNAIYASSHLIEYIRNIYIGNMQFEEIDDDDDDIDFLQGNSKEDLMNFFHDGDCFMLRTSLRTVNRGLYNDFYLKHINLVNEIECTPRYCHHTSSRAINDRMAKLIKSHYIQSHMKQTVSFDERIKMEFKLNFRQYTYLHCSELPPQCQSPFKLPYLRNRG